MKLPATCLKLCPSSAAKHRMIRTACVPYSKANANSGTRGGGAASLWKRRIEELHVGDSHEERVDVEILCLEAILDMCRNDGGAAMVAVEEP